MTINSLKELKKLITTCRALGVTDIKINGIELHLGAMPYKVTADRPKRSTLIPTSNPEADLAIEKIETDSFDNLSDEAKLFYSVQENVEASN